MALVKVCGTGRDRITLPRLPEYMAEKAEHIADLARRIENVCDRTFGGAEDCEKANPAPEPKRTAVLDRCDEQCTKIDVALNRLESQISRLEGATQDHTGQCGPC